MTKLIDMDYIAETAACYYEDGDRKKAQALVAMMTEEERAEFTWYVNDIEEKRARKAEYDRIANPPKRSTRAARNAAAYVKANPDCPESAILAAGEID